MYRRFPVILVCLFFICACRNVNLCFAEDPHNEVAKKPQFVEPTVPQRAYAAFYFSSPDDLSTKLVLSQAKKDGAEEAVAKYDGHWAVEVPASSAVDNDYALVLKSQAKHHAVAFKLSRPIRFDTPQLVVQYEVKFQDGIECGGSYVKLISSADGLDLTKFNDKTPYTIMFGPDKCGADYKFHFIIRHKNPISGVYEEKHAKRVKGDIESYFTDKKTHLYTLVLNSDSTFERYIDQVKVQIGSLLEDMEPPINPAEEVDDPADKKPSDWDDREKILDEKAKKPDDWDENEPATIIDESATKPEGWLDNEPDLIPDPSAQQPKDWDVELDGEWEAPKVANPKCENAPGCGEWHKPHKTNPKYKGKWIAPMIPNPAFKGIWTPKKIPNLEFFEDKEPFKSLTEVTAVGLELWSMTSEIAFDNFLVVDSLDAANEFAQSTWLIKQNAERLADPKAHSVVDAVRQTYHEKPWLIVIVSVLCAVPVVLLIYFMCCRSSTPPSRVSHKKTDEVIPDEIAAELTQAQPTKGDDEVVDDDSSEEDMVQVKRGANGDSEKPTVSKADLESESDDEPISTETIEPDKRVTKRRARKE